MAGGGKERVQSEAHWELMIKYGEEYLPLDSLFLQAVFANMQQYSVLLRCEWCPAARHGTVNGKGMESTRKRERNREMQRGESARCLWQEGKEKGRWCMCF